MKFNSNSLKLNVGCGKQMLPDYIGLDQFAGNGVDIICNLNRPLPLPASSVQHIYTKSVLEHIESLEFLLGEFDRVLQENGTIYIYVPHWSNPFYYSDYTHVRFFGLATFDYFMDAGTGKYRRVPAYSNIRFKTKKVRLLFGSPFKLMHWLLKAIQWIVNKHPKFQLFFEYHIAGIIPCYALEYHLKKAE